jgi:hypothetical protein
MLPSIRVVDKQSLCTGIHSSSGLHTLSAGGKNRDRRRDVFVDSTQRAGFESRKQRRVMSCGMELGMREQDSGGLE